MNPITNEELESARLAAERIRVYWELFAIQAPPFDRSVDLARSVGMAIKDLEHWLRIEKDN